MKPTHTFNVDLSNPGQFLACCGLLELANCLDPQAQGWFEGTHFHLRLADKHKNFVEGFIDCRAMPATDEVTSTKSESDAEDSDDKSPPLLLDKPFNFLLNWWEDTSAVRAGFKTWSGGQTVLGFFDGMRKHVRDNSLIGAGLFTQALALNKPKPFYFDSRLSILTTIDMGFSAENFSATYSPAVEVLTLVGLQRFRPKDVELREKYFYSVWNVPLSVNVAAAVAHGLIPELSHLRFQFPFVVRTGGKYKAFGPARPTRSDHARASQTV